MEKPAPSRDAGLGLEPASGKGGFVQLFLAYWREATTIGRSSTMSTHWAELAWDWRLRKW